MSGGTVMLTFDNLGAAAEVEAGLAPEDAPEDDHPSLRVLPLLLDLLDELALPATFFVEAVNCERHPAAVTTIAARGHEVAHHAWRHERWGELAPAREEAVLARGVAAFAALGLAVRGFRPPGGALRTASAALLRAHGLDWCSPEGTRAGLLAGDVVSVPFRWPLVDALYRYGPFAALREAHGMPAVPLGADAAGERLWGEVRAAEDPVAATLVLHPFLMAGEGEPDPHLRLLRRLAAARDRGELRVADGRTLADELRAGP